MSFVVCYVLLFLLLCVCCVLRLGCTCCCGRGRGCGCVSACFVTSCTEQRSRVYIQNAPVCTFKTPVSCVTWAFETTHGCTHGSVSGSPPFSHVSLFSSHLISSHLISSHLISSHLISSHLISSHLISLSLLSMSLLMCLRLFSSLLVCFCFFLLSLSLSILSALSLFNDDDNEHSSGWLSPYTRL